MYLLTAVSRYSVVVNTSPMTTGQQNHMVADQVLCIFCMRLKRLNVIQNERFLRISIKGWQRRLNDECMESCALQHVWSL